MIPLKNRIAWFASLVLLAIILGSWGYQGHHKINTAASYSFNEEMAQFSAWVSVLAQHASDADFRKDEDPDEAPKHYIDIDAYPVFLQTGRIPHTYDSVVAMYGHSFVLNNGTLPWATVAAYDTLVRCFARRDWDRAVLIASDLGHYIGDGHMPLHITRNYNGQYTGNSGIHARYESTMIDTYIQQINYQGTDIHVIPDVNAYVLNYLYASYTCIDSVLMADDFATEAAGNTTSDTYTELLWNRTKRFTIPLFADASHCLAELMYTAWTEAGKPMINASGIHEPGMIEGISVFQNYPNPVSGRTSIRLMLQKGMDISVRVLDFSGNVADRISDGFLSPGEHTFQWDSTGFAPGVYYLQLKSGNHYLTRKLLVVR